MRNVLLIVVLLCFTCHLHAQKLNQEFFKNPPKEAKPKTWMHAMSGNMSKAGLTKDLESMAEVGIGGLLLFNITQGIPNGNIKYNSPEHHEMLKHAAKEAERLGLTFGIHNCDGWSSSGGPWIPPEESMKMVVWSETIVKGNKKTAIQLAQPTTREGFYKDISVLAYPSLVSELADFNSKPTITASDNGFDIAVATDNRRDKETVIQKLNNEKPWIQYDFGQKFTVRSCFMLFNDREGEAEILISDDGKNFKPVHALKKVRTGKGEWAFNDNFKALTARYFRIQLKDKTTIKELNLSATYTIDNPLGRTAIGRTEDSDFTPIGEPDASMIINKNTIIDLSAFMDKSGLLQTDLPEGNWTIMRFGYTSTSASNNPASEEGKGLEVDKLSRMAFKKHYDAFVKKVIDNTKDIAPNALQYVEIDSYEMGGQNWTEDLVTTFKQENGYEIMPFLPLIAGRFIESAKASDAILTDFRGVICNMMTENYFGYFQELCHKDGLKTYIEPYGFGPLNDLDVGAKADLVMGEFWMNRPITQVASAVSAAHIYGKEIVSAESFTAEPQINWKGHPAMGKISGDKAWAVGVNEFMFHRFAHQANTHVEPGMTMNRWGSHFDRTQTWWKDAGSAWFKYIARGSYLLRQGVPVADLLVFVGDASPNSTFGRNDFSPKIPKGVNFDCVNADVLINRMTYKNGELRLPEGTRYKALILRNSTKIKLKTLRKIHEFAQNGVPIIGQKPQELMGYMSDSTQRNEFKKLIDTIWSKPKTSTDFDWERIFQQNNIQNDFVIEGRTDIDFMHRKIGTTDIYFMYNPDSVARIFKTKFNTNSKIPELWNPINGEIKKIAQFSENEGFINVQIPLNAEESTFVIFRESSKNTIVVSSDKISDIDLLFDKTNNIQARINKNGTFKTTLNSGKTWKIDAQDIPSAVNLTDSWQVQFNGQQGFGRMLNFDSLIDWKHHPNDSIQHYSGTATYTTSFKILQKTQLSNTRILLDLGQVNIVASVKLNGKDCGVSWMPPFVIDITDAVMFGKNNLEIKVTNQWSNRLIGDERFPANDGGYKLESHNPKGKMPTWYVNNEPLPKGQRTTFTTAPFYKATDELMPSGLVGPVKIMFQKITILQKKTLKTSHK